MTQLPDEAKLTAYALGELDEAQRAKVQARLASDAAARAEVADIRRMAGLLRAELAAEARPALTPFQRARLEAEAAKLAGAVRRREPARRAIWLRLAPAVGAAAAVALLALGLTWQVMRPHWSRGPDDRGPRLPGPVAVSTPGPSRGGVSQPQFAGTPRDVLPPWLWGGDERPSRTGRDDGPDAFDRNGERAFRKAVERPVSGFPPVAGATSYAAVQRALEEEGRWPDKGAVRIEELINSFPYDYAGPKDGDALPIAIRADVTGCPWQGRHRLLRVALKARGRTARFDVLPEAREVFAAEAAGTFAPVAANVSIEVEFHRAKVAAYRLLGYDSRPRDGDSQDAYSENAREIGAGHAVTALYEIIPTDGDAATFPAAGPAAGRPAGAGGQAGGGAVCTVRVGYQPPGGGARAVLARQVLDAGDRFDQADTDFRFAAAVAAFGMILRDSSYRGDATLEAVLQQARGALGDDPFGYRLAFLRAVEAARELRAGSLAGGTWGAGARARH